MPIREMLKDEEKRKRLLIFLAGFSIAVLTAVTFYPALQNGFVNYDDGGYIFENPGIRGFTWENIKSWFSLWYGIGEFFQPVRWVAYALIYEFFGLDPFGFHLASYIFHTINAVLVFWLLMKITRSNLFVSFTAAMLFAIHPMRVESVAWASEMKDVLYLFFYVLAFIAFINYRRELRKRFYVLSLILFMLSLMSKPTAMTFPFVMVVWEFYEGKRFEKIHILDKIPFLIPSIITSAIVIHVRNECLGFSTIRKSIEEHRPLYTRILIAINSFSFYLYKTFDPRRLSSFYTYPRVVSIRMWRYYVPIIVLAVSAAGSLFSLKYTKKIMFGFLFFIVAFLPHSHLVAYATFSYSNRATYLASLGFLLLIAYLLYEFWRIGKGSLLVRALCVVLLMVVFGELSWLSARRVGVWKDAETLWKHVLDYDPNSTFAYFNLGNIVDNDDRPEEAKRYYQESIKVYPQYYEGHDALAGVLEREGDTLGAIAMYQKCLELLPGDNTHAELGKLYLRLKNYSKAKEHCEKAIEMNPENPAAHFNLGNVYLYVKKYDRAIEEYEKTVAINPKAYGAYENMGIIHLRRGDPDRALEYYRKSLEITKGDPFTYVNFSRAYIVKGLYKEALGELDKALALARETRLVNMIEERRQAILKAIEEGRQQEAPLAEPAPEEQIRPGE